MLSDRLNVLPETDAAQPTRQVTEMSVKSMLGHLEASGMHPCDACNKVTRASKGLAALEPECGWQRTPFEMEGRFMFVQDVRWVVLF